CLGTKHLKQDEKMLYRQRINAPKTVNKYALKDLYVQESNKKFLGLRMHSLVSMYYFGQRRFKPTKIENKLKRAEEKFDAKIEASKTEKREANLQFKKQRKTAALKEKLANGNIWMKWGEPVSVYDSARLQLTTERFRDYLFNHGYFKNEVLTRTTTE